MTQSRNASPDEFTLDALPILQTHRRNQDGARRSQVLDLCTHTQAMPWLRLQLGGASKANPNPSQPRISLACSHTLRGLGRLGCKGLLGPSSPSHDNAHAFTRRGAGHFPTGTRSRLLQITCFSCAVLSPARASRAKTVSSCPIGHPAPLLATATRSFGTRPPGEREITV